MTPGPAPDEPELGRGVLATFVGSLLTSLFVLPLLGGLLYSELAGIVRHFWHDVQHGEGNRFDEAQRRLTHDLNALFHSDRWLIGLAAAAALNALVGPLFLRLFMRWIAKTRISYREALVAVLCSIAATALVAGVPLAGPWAAVVASLFVPTLVLQRRRGFVQRRAALPLALLLAAACVGVELVLLSVLPTINFV